MLYRLAGRAQPRPGRRDAHASAQALLAEWLTPPTPAPLDEPPSPPGWHESSFELRRGLEVQEIFRHAPAGGASAAPG